MGWELFVERVIGAFKYLLALAMMVSGIQTALGPLTPVEGALGWIYSTRLALIWFGVIFFLCGLTLFIGKMRKSKKATGVGLMAIYLCFVFATILNYLAFGWAENVTSNLIMAIIVGGLWLRWRFKTYYVNPNHFKRQIDKHNLAQ